jgi:uncharacterized protein YjbI with pentapeptide repeats
MKTIHQVIDGVEILRHIIVNQLIHLYQPAGRSHIFSWRTLRMTYQANDISVTAFLAILQQEDRAAARIEIDRLTQAQIIHTGRGWNLSAANLSSLDCSGLNLEKAVLHRTALYETNLRKTSLRGAWISCAGMEKTNLSGADLSGANLHAIGAQVCNFSNATLDYLVDATGGLFHGCDFTGSTAAYAKLSGTTFYQTHLAQANFQGADLEGCVFTESNMTEIVLCRANLTGAMIQRCQMRGADLSQSYGADVTLRDLLGCNGLTFAGANLPRLTLKRVSGQAVIAENLQAASAHIEECVLPDCKMTKLNAYGMVVKDADLSRADFSGAYLYRSSWTGKTAATMSLRGTIFSSANLVQADMFADLTGAECQQADLSYARLNLCNLTDINLHGARLHQTTMVKAIQPAQPSTLFALNRQAITHHVNAPTNQLT